MLTQSLDSNFIAVSSYPSLELSSNNKISCFVLPVGLDEIFIFYR